MGHNKYEAPQTCDLNSILLIISNVDWIMIHMVELDTEVLVLLQILK